MPDAAERDAPQRPGMALTEDLIRKKAEHNEGMLSTLEEIALHQLDIDRIEVLIYRTLGPRASALLSPCLIPNICDL